ncbi:type II toxin-antitoxin system HipA family toxin [Castellaniella sp.]|uniref:type II toxin-antitoxin system HipA family toxin n=1 Tax=Castellaniella sp. TaxID=1955812 RepID=UPI003A8DC478
MARRSKTRSLTLWANGIRVGDWQISRRNEDVLQYDLEWLASPQGRALSLSLPFTADNQPLRGAVVHSYFDNLLPDSEAVRRRLHTRFRTLNTEAFSLLEAIGRDCVGAIQLLPDGEAPQGLFEIQTQALSERQIADTLRATAAAPAALGQHDALDQDFRISIAGAQEKTALTLHDGQWCKPIGSTPTTHIFKLPLGLVGGRQADMSTSVENEWLCTRLLQNFDLPTARCTMARFEDQKALVVERFDRRLSSERRYWLRLPQEDFCQATGTPPGARYEADGGPGWVDIAQILQQSESRKQDLRTLLLAQLLFWLMAATDGHAKNFSIFLLPGGRYHLTPLYDVLSAWPVTGTGPNELDRHRLKLAMASRGANPHYRWKDIQRRHFNHTARLCGWGIDMEDLIAEALERLPQVLAQTQSELTDGFPERIFESIAEGMTDSARRLRQMPQD